MTIDYQELLDEAMLGLVRKVLIKAEDVGLQEDTHLYISFRTDHPDVVLSERMKQKYPQEITIVLQNQYEDLLTRQEYFSVKLSFNGIKEVVKVPFTAITSFVDPRVRFSLQFTPKLNNKKQTPAKDKISISKDLPEAEHASDNVIVLDKFRNNKNKRI